MMKKTKISFVVLLCLQLFAWAQQQPRLVGIYSDQKKNSAKVEATDSTVLIQTLSLPFFDNFIITGVGNSPNPDLWYKAGGVKISNTMSKSIPDFNAAIFDGTDSSGTPYSFASPIKRGITDSLVSHFIDLSNVSIPVNKESDPALCLSFYVQNGGYGEVADGLEGDQFALSFKNKSGVWEQVWARRDTLPNIRDTAVVDRSYKSFFKNVYKPELFLNTQNDSVSFIKKIYPTLSDYSPEDQLLKDSMKAFFPIWEKSRDFSTQSDSAEKIDFYKKVYPWDQNYEVNYQSFFKNIYHRKKNFNLDTISLNPLVLINDSLEYFKKMYPKELYPEAYYKVFFGTLKLDTNASSNLENQYNYKYLPFFYKNFKSDKKVIDDYTFLYKNEQNPSLKEKLGNILDSIKFANKLDSVKYYRSIVNHNITESNESFNRYDYVFDKAEDQRFLHSEFRMAFVSKGRQSGSFDIWGLDYVYLRSGILYVDANIPTRRIYLDKNDASISGQLPGILKNYNSMPLKHVNSNTEFIDSLAVDFFDFKRSTTSTTDPLTVQYDDVTSGSPVFLESVLLPTKQLVENDQFSITMKMPAPKPKAFDLNLEYTEILTTVLLNDHKDSVANNDKIMKKTVLSNYYAYDDGSAERAFEVSGRYSELAYKFKCPSDSSQLTQVRLYFPKIISSNNGKSFTLKVWKRISDPQNGRRQDSVLYSAVKVISYPEAGKDSLNGFVEFNIDSVVKVVDSFYVGYELLTSDPIYTGYDLNPNINSAKKIYYNTDGNWAQYTGKGGNLMLRPVFGKYRNGGAERKGDNKIAKDYNIYPNPSQGNEVTIEGELPIKLRVYDVLGAQQSGFSYNSDTGKLNVGGLKSGIYTLKIIGPEVIVYKKIIVN